MRTSTLAICLLGLLLLSPAAEAKRMIGYYSLAEGYANQEGCAPILTPDRIKAELYTHIIFSFVFINGTDHTIQLPDAAVQGQMNQVQALRAQNPSIKMMISLGGWSMDMSLYSNAVATPENRAALVNSVMQFCRQWNWDGIDFDWEYPNDPARGGTDADSTNFPIFMQEMRKAVEAENVPAGKEKLILSLALPGGPYHGQHYNMPLIIQSADFANIMAYNLHGPWEPLVYCSANYYDGTPEGSQYHGYSIHDAIEYFLTQNGQTLPADKFNLGVTFAGVAFTLGNPAVNAPGSPAVGEGVGGTCTKEAGYMAYFEVENILASGNGLVTQPKVDEVGVCKYFVVNNNQWIGYDDAETLAKKVGLVEARGLGGISVWAMYAENPDNAVLTHAIHDALWSGSNSASGLSISFMTMIALFAFVIRW